MPSTYHIINISIHNSLHIQAYDTCEATGMCHHTTHYYNQTDGRTTYLVGLGQTTTIPSCLINAAI